MIRLRLKLDAIETVPPTVTLFEVVTVLLNVALPVTVIVLLKFELPVTAIVLLNVILISTLGCFAILLVLTGLMLWLI